MRASQQSSPKKVPRIRLFMFISDIILPFRGLGDRHPSACSDTANPLGIRAPQVPRRRPAPRPRPAPLRLRTRTPDTQVPDALQE